MSAELFYPTLTDQERVTWTHWLSNSVVCNKNSISQESFEHILRELKATEKVLAEFALVWRMDFFQAYELRRGDEQEFLLLGQIRGQSYRLTRWGENLRSPQEVNVLVQQSLIIKARTARRRVWLGWGAILPGLALALWLGFLLWQGKPVSTGLLLTFLVFLCASTPAIFSTPEKRARRYLDRYRF